MPPDGVEPDRVSQSTEPLLANEQSPASKSQLNWRSSTVGDGVGERVGSPLGGSVGSLVGTLVGTREGVRVEDGAKVGVEVGSSLGAQVASAHTISEIQRFVLKSRMGNRHKQLMQDVSVCVVAQVDQVKLCHGARERTKPAVTGIGTRSFPKGSAALAASLVASQL